MPTLSFRSLDQAFPRRWPRLFRQPTPVPVTLWPLRFALVLQLALATAMVLGLPLNEWAASLIGATIGMLLYSTVIGPRLQRAHSG